MLQNGRYSAWFRTPEKEGMGVIVLADGLVSGGDAAFSYIGSYTQDGDQFTANIMTRRFVEGQPALLGIDEVDVQLIGTSKSTTASCKGTVRQIPGVPFEAVLVRMEG